MCKGALCGILIKKQESGKQAMYAKVTSLGVTGLAGYIVQVEADLSGGLPQFNLVGRSPLRTLRVGV